MYRRTMLSRRAAAMFALAAGLSGTANASLMNFETASVGSFPRLLIRMGFGSPSFVGTMMFLPATRFLCAPG